MHDIDILSLSLSLPIFSLIKSMKIVFFFIEIFIYKEVSR